MIALLLLSPFFTEAPPSTPGVKPEERTVQIEVQTNALKKSERSLIFVVSIRNSEHRAQCLPWEVVPDTPQYGRQPVLVYDTRGREVEFVDLDSTSRHDHSEVFVALRPKSELRRVILAGNDYRFPPGRREYVAEVVFGAFYCDELNFGRARTPIIFRGQSKRFRM